MKQGRRSTPPASSGRQGRGQGHIARKRFGQHFLTDTGVIDEIVTTINPLPGQAVVEVGPGLGALTQPLVERCGRLTVIELDRDLAARLRKRPDLNVVESDVLKVDFAALAQSLGSQLRVVGNLPYNISTPILFHLLEHVDHIVDQHFMLQKEVVDRMAAEPGNKDYGRLTVMLQWRYAITAVCDVPPESFEPPPKVDSAVVRMVPHAQATRLLAPKLLAELVMVAFSQRRKLLRHTLGAWLTQHAIDDAFDLARRAEEVPVHEFVALAQRCAAQLPHAESPT